MHWCDQRTNLPAPCTSALGSAHHPKTPTSWAWVVSSVSISAFSTLTVSLSCTRSTSPYRSRHSRAIVFTTDVEAMRARGEALEALKCSARTIEIARWGL